MNRSVKEEIFADLAAIGQALGNGHRLRIINSLSHGEKSVERLAEIIGQSMAATSAHLKVLRGANLLAAEKRGKHVWYRLQSDQVAALWLALRDLGEAISPTVREAKRNVESSDNALSPLNEQETWATLQRGRSVLLDLRPADEYAAAHLPKARNVPFEEMSEAIGSLPKTKPLLVYCRGPYCQRAMDGVQQLLKRKLPAQRLRFSVPEWRAAGLPLERSPA